MVAQRIINKTIKHQSFMMRHYKIIFLSMAKHMKHPILKMRALRIEKWIFSWFECDIFMFAIGLNSSWLPFEIWHLLNKILMKLFWKCLISEAIPFACTMSTIYGGCSDWDSLFFRQSECWTMNSPVDCWS